MVVGKAKYRVLVALDSFKESAPSRVLGEALARGLQRSSEMFECFVQPVADGGEGTAMILGELPGAQMRTCVVEGPLGAPVQARYVLRDCGQACIELAEASGLHLVPAAERDVLRASTRGTGQVILDAIRNGARSVLLCLGGSATCDGGAGLVQALGVRLTGCDGSELAGGGGALLELAGIDVSALEPCVKDIIVDLACDVDNPLLGPAGAAAVYGPQKGASVAQVATLERGLRHWAESLEKMGYDDVRNVPGAGAAGGTPVGVAAFLSTTFLSGSELLAKVLGLEELVAQADLVITGEGSLDYQTMKGKVPVQVSRLARKHQKPLIGLCGRLGAGWEDLVGPLVDTAFPLAPGPISLEDSLQNAESLAEAAGYRLGTVLCVGGRLFS